MADIGYLDAIVGHGFVNDAKNPNYKTAIAHKVTLHGRAPKRIFLQPFDSFDDFGEKRVGNLGEILLRLTEKINFSHLGGFLCGSLLEV